MVIKPILDVVQLFSIQHTHLFVFAGWRRKCRILGTASGRTFDGGGVKSILL